MKNVLKYTALGLASGIALTYAFGYDYLFKGVAKTYLKGESGATIDDADLFPQHIISKGNPRPWVHDSLYNKLSLTKTLEEDLKKSNTAAFLVARDGRLLHEQYWNGYTATSQTNSFSMAKGVTALLLGAAIMDGKISSENALYSEFYENYRNVPYGDKLSLKHLVTMEAGLDWDEDYKNPFKPNAKAYYGNSLAKAVLLRGFKTTPGTEFEYQSGSTQLLGFALRKVTNIPLADFASARLWKPLGMEQHALWTVDDNEMEKTFCCIHSNARDFAKLGQLMLEDGKVDSLQVIPFDYIEKMRTPTAHSKGAYGYGLWINNEVKNKHYYFLGLYGQYIIVVPEKKLVIVRTGMYKNLPKDEKGRPFQVNTIVDEVVKMTEK